MNFIGEKFDSLGQDRFNLLEICCRLRADLKKEFPKPWKFTVRKNQYQSITISIRKAPFDLWVDPLLRPFILSEDSFGKEIFDKLMNLAHAYNYDNSDGSTDYFDRNYYLHWDLSHLEAE